jgi:hypothetical protein
MVLSYSSQTPNTQHGEHYCGLARPHRRRRGLIPERPRPCNFEFLLWC